MYIHTHTRTYTLTGEKGRSRNGSEKIDKYHMFPLTGVGKETGIWGRRTMEDDGDENRKSTMIRTCAMSS